ncbi:DNA polymerase III subunit alpha [Candidatus Portiera aleyrodidarum]|uniref:DNA polymerase III subunit alpha n=1 Tax=Candidatus Portiera aleyrodidarum TaxID=91844 RepID=UPI0005D88F3E|nr:DNA polymerase III subunit alpha [Candidatus Portiera aleyrodidarum]CEL12284.1 DNA polymerase III subunit alpha [Candidatus Portiera aleyrodidarum]
MTNFIHLRIHSEYSLRNSIIKINSLIYNIKKMNIPAVCITDENNIFSLIKVYKKSIKNGIKQIIGCDLHINSKNKIYKITLLAMNNLGYKNLIKLITLSCKDILIKKYIFKYSKGLIVLSGASKGEIGYFLLSNNKKKANLIIDQWKKFFHNSFYLELQRIGLKNEEELLYKSIDLAIKKNIPVVATNDVMFIKKEDYYIHQTRVAISEGKLIKKNFYSKEQYLKTPKEMIDLFKDIPEAIENSIMIAMRCNVNLNLNKKNVCFPKFKLSKNINIKKYFIYLSNKGLNNRLIKNNILKNKKIIKYKNRLYKEINLIKKMGFIEYFLIVMDFIKWAKKTKIPVGPGRGSGAGSLVAYSLEITDIDPIKYDLLFERFLNSERINLPDFDVDFCMIKRDKVIKYVTKLYGKKLVAHIVTFSTMTAKSVIRDVTRVKGKPHWLGDKLSKLIPFDSGITLNKACENSLELRNLIKNNEEANEIWEMALELEGIIKGIGKHAGGIIIAPDFVGNYSPLLCDDKGKNIIQFDKNDIKYLGFIKFDFLGLRTLTVINYTLILINKSINKKININNIPLNDLNSFKLLKKAETTSIFQLESKGMRVLIKKIKPNNINDIISLIALFRPGPLNSGMVDEFIKRKIGKKIKFSYYKIIEPILKSTYGIILYQEQVMKITNLLTGFSLGKSDLFRRAIEKNKNIKKHRINFIKNCVKNNIKKYIAIKIFEIINKFAGYGFNKSHSTAYGLISYKTIWLKSNYPSQYMASVLSSEMYKIEKLIPIILECKRMKLNILPPNINISNYKFSVDKKNNIIYGLGAIKGLGKEFIKEILIKRKKNGIFYDLFDFCKRINIKYLNKRNLSALILSGSLDKIGPSREILLDTIKTAIKIAYQKKNNIRMGINDLFNNIEYKKYEYTKPFKILEKLQGEKNTLGIYISFINS